MDADLLRGNVDRFESDEVLAGWVFDPCEPLRTDIHVTAYVMGAEVAHSNASLPRGDGYHGFRLMCNQPGLATRLIAGQVVVVARAARGSEAILNLYKPMLETLRALHETGDRSEPSLPDPGGRSKIDPPENVEDLSALLFAVGLKSKDESVILGRRGYLFLYRGSNDVAALHERPEDDPYISQVAGRWLEVLEGRRRALKALGTSFLQLIIPEKSTVLTEEAPEGLGPITPLLSRLEKVLANVGGGNGGLAQPPDYYLPLLPVLRKVHETSAPPFLRTDSHLSTRGAWNVLRACVRHVAPMFPAQHADFERALSALDAQPREHAPRAFSGDISCRLFGEPIIELVEQLEFPSFSDYAPGLQETIVFSPPDGAHIGHHIVWRNSTAPIRLKVIAFANSFFERGSAPRLLSWWCKHLFAEFHFLWDPLLQADYAAFEKPDLVICQSIERFLGIVPKV